MRRFCIVTASCARWWPALVLLALWFAAFYPVFPDLIGTWFEDSNNSHGVLVPLISAYFAWQRREELSGVEAKSSLLGAGLLCASLALYIVSYAGAIAFGTRATMVASLVGLVLFNFGSGVLSVVAFPLCYLFFMIPVPLSVYTFFAFPLQLFATDVSAFLLRTLNIPVLKEGNMLYFAQTQLEVAEACSGLRSIMSFIMLSCLFAYMMTPFKGRRYIMILSAIPLALFANIVRITGTGVLAHFFGGEVADGFLHDFSGLVVFAFGFALMMLIYNRLEGSIRRDNAQ